jgi:hypothetical protein
MKLRLTLLAILEIAGCSPPTGPILDKQALLDRQRWWDNRDWDWYKARIPFFDSPDPEINSTYYYRWELITKHLTYGSPETGYTFTEFIDRPFWSGAFGSISCPLGHQFYEVRWLKDRRVVEDFARYWFETPGAEPRSYSNWYGDAMWATYLVLGDTSFLRTVLPHMETQYQGWVAEHLDSIHSMFRWDGMHDGMETNIDSRQTADEFSGADGYRPTINSYLYGDMLALSRAAARLGDSTTSALFRGRAAALKLQVQTQLWDPARQFFFHQFSHDEKDGIHAGDLTYQSGRYAGNPHGRELIGYVPWQFNLPDSGYEGAWRFLMDTAYFAAPFGPTTTERHDPQFYVSPKCCVWSGNSWPYATTQTLVAMANLLNNYRQSVVSKADWFRLLRTYTMTQRRDGQPYIAEAANPDNGSWDGHNTFYHSEHYFHSGYVDLIITGVAGLRPRDDSLLEVNPLAPSQWDWFALDDVGYRGHRISIIWDRDGSHYGRGSGLTLYADGRRLASSPRMERLVVPLGAAIAPGSVDRPVNLAVNNGRGPFPWVTASFSAPGTSPHYLIDGNRWYLTAPPNRWATTGSGSDTNWVLLDFGIARPVESLALYFLDDSTGIKPPIRYDVESWSGTGWVSIPGQGRQPATPEGRRANIVTFPRIEAGRLRVRFVSQPGQAMGLTELEAWAHVAMPLPQPVGPSGNLAYGARASASFTSPYDKIEEVNDMKVAFSHYSRNRWTAFGSPHPSDWVELDLAHPERVGLVDIYLWGDNGGVKAPRRYRVQYWDRGHWVDARIASQTPVTPQVSSLNSVHIDPVETNRVRVVFEHDLPAKTGVTELMLWQQP